ncbi:MAG: hypothetical protein ACRENE_33130 [Polyangiaceae bacterium]
MRLSPADAVAMRGKYAEMHALRLEHARGAEDATRVRPRLSDLASRFPGALREIDRLELAEIERRIVTLDAFVGGAGAAEPWMGAVARFHRLARGALGAKRWLDRRRVVDASVFAAFEREVPTLAFSEEIQSWRDELAAVAAPPGGRVMNLVFLRLARELDVSEPAVRELVFGRRRVRDPPTHSTGGPRRGR